jgi:hypothetical protein
MHSTLATAKADTTRIKQRRSLPSVMHLSRASFAAEALGKIFSMTHDRGGELHCG